MSRMNTDSEQKISVVVPVFNEEDCIKKTLDELFGILQNDFPERFEVIVINDGSTDQTSGILQSLASTNSNMQLFSLDKNYGQSAAFGAGFRMARNDVVVTIDADGQYDPKDIKKVVDGLDGADVCCGYRSQRRDTWSKRIGSLLGNGTRNLLLKESIRDTGCSLKAFRKEIVCDLPMAFAGMHRFLPALCVMKGAVLRELPVNHRFRLAGKSKYTNWSRLKVTASDVFAVRWMQRRYRKYFISVQPKGYPYVERIP